MTGQTDSFRYTLGYYRTPLIVIAIGVILSIAGFALTLASQANAQKRDFVTSAEHDTVVIDGRFLMFQERMRAFGALFEAFDKVDQGRLQNFIQSMLPRIRFGAMGWLPEKNYGTPPFIVAVGPPPSVAVFTTIPQIRSALQREKTTRDFTISAPFLYAGPGGAQEYLAMLVPLVEHDAVQGSLVALLNLKQLYEEGQKRILTPAQATIYLFDTSPDNVLVHTIGQPDISAGPGPVSLQRAISRTPFCYSQVLQGAQGQRRIVFVPTHQYLLGALGPWPWIVLVFSLTITGLISLMTFQQARQGIIVSRKVDEQTRDLSRISHSLTEQEKRAATMQGLMSAIVASSDDAIISKTLDGIISSWNKGAEQLFGYTAAEAVGLPVDLLIPPDRQGEELHFLAELLAGRRVERFETLRKTRDGRILCVSVTISPIYNGEGQIIGASKIARDITESKKAEEALLRSNRELEKFAYVASHDLKAPLRNIDDLAKWVLEDTTGILPPDAHDKMTLLRRRVADLETLLDDILAYSRAGRMVDHPVDVDLQEMVGRLAETHVSASFKVQIKNPLPVLFSFRTPLEQIFGNLLSNAVKHHDRGEGRIEVDAREAGKFWEFTVRDDGPGIPPEFHDRVFQMFQTLQSRDKVAGSGLGLAIVKKLVEWQNGKIWIESEKEARGTTIHFLWPRNANGGHNL